MRSRPDRIIGRDKPEIHNAHAASYWLDHCGDLLQQVMLCRGLTLPSWCAALLAHGDIPHTITERYPHELSFGLHYGSAGQPARDCWRRVLEIGRVLPPAHNEIVWTLPNKTANGGLNDQQCYPIPPSTESVRNNDMVRRHTGLMALIHCGVSRFDMLGEKLGIEQGRRETIVR